ncbi:MAG: 2-oxoacid:acceptor oxidoreductase family protein [Deltaproteobacteria bacterium]|nr:2-oxoacid:acceptor oxidoreductase family protein [Deltaproteobacteria bacterium]MBW2132250.1 2-oxoacid:acceptor oxidoreductase family protein [Deltaproteobacteria bacterium]
MPCSSRPRACPKKQPGSAGRRTFDFYAAFLDPTCRIFTVDAGAVAVAHGLGSALNPIVNTAILGALARTTELVTLASVEQAIEAYVPVKPEANRQAARRAYESVAAGTDPSKGPETHP